MGARPRVRQGLARLAIVGLAAAFTVSACGRSASDERVLQEPATVEHVEGSDVARVILTDRAAATIQLQTAPARAAGKRILVPSAALLVDPQGRFWVYTSPEPLLFVRHRISIDREEGGQAFLLEGPPAGTQVVTVGVAELYGAEFGIGH